MVSRQKLLHGLPKKAFYHLDAPVQRLGAMDVPIPFSPALEDLTVAYPG